MTNQMTVYRTTFLLKMTCRIHFQDLAIMWWNKHLYKNYMQQKTSLCAPGGRMTGLAEPAPSSEMLSWQENNFSI